MGLDQLLELTSDVAMKALPIVGVIVLILLGVFVKHLITVMKSANKAIDTVNKTLNTANRQLDALDKPLNTLNELSDTVDSVHEASKAAIRSSMMTIIQNFSTIKDWVLSLVKKQKNEFDFETEAKENEDHGNEESW